MNDSDIVKEFLVESYENLDRLERDLVAWEKDPSNREILAGVFRTIHTIKGTSGFLVFNKLEAVTHVGESLLARLRDGQLTLGPEITTAIAGPGGCGPPDARNGRRNRKRCGRLGAVLVDQKRITAEELAQALEEQIR